MPDLLNRMTADEIFDRLETVSPEIARFRAKDREKIEKQRAAAVDAIEKTEAEFGPKLQAAADVKKKAEAKAEQLRRDHQAAVGAAFSASQQLFSLDATMRRQIGQQERILRSTADPRIGRLRREISDALDTPFGGVTPGSVEPVHKPLPQSLNGSAQDAAVAAAKQAQAEYDTRVKRTIVQRAALRELDALELEAIDGVELTKRLANIRARALPTNGYHSIKL